MLHGKGKQRYISKSYEEDRKKGLSDRTKIDSSLHDWYGINVGDGGGRTDINEPRIKQFPFPTDPSIKSRKRLNIRKIDPKLGEQSD